MKSQKIFKYLLNVNSLINELDKNGVVVVHECISADVLDSLNAEFDSAFQSTQSELKHGVDPASKYVRISAQNLDRNTFPIVHRVFTCKEFTEITNAYRGRKHSSKDALYFSHAYKPEAITDIHFDTFRNLKFFIYLTDTDESNGAISFAKGTHTENTRYRDMFLKQGGELKKLLNVVPSTEELELETIVGKAGTLIIFDTDAFHKGGKVQEGKERRVIRLGYRFPAQPASMKHKIYTKNWWLSRIKPPDLPLNAVGRSSSRGRSRSYTRSKRNYASRALKDFVKKL